MLVKRFVVVLLIAIATLLGVGACALDEISESYAVTLPSVTKADSNQIQNSGEGIVVNVTPMPDIELSVQPPSQTEPDAGAGYEDSQMESEGQENEFRSEIGVLYSDSIYKFGVGYPSNFLFRTQPTEKLEHLNPIPSASFTFMNPVTASNDQAGLELADLEIRVYAAGQAKSLNSWLISMGLLSADSSIPIQQFQTINVSGIKVCASTMIIPRCSYFIIGNGWVYQLIPVTLEGEAMLHTFMLIP